MNIIAKFFVFLFGYVIYAFSFLVPRSKNKLAFGSFRGTFNGNAKYLFISLSENSDKNIVWLSDNKKTVAHIKSLGLKAYFIGSFKGFWFALKAKYWFFNSYSSDILFFASGSATLINLWHGLALIKKIEFEITSGELAKRYVKKTIKERFFHPECFIKPDFVLSSTNFQSKIFAKAFRIDVSQCINIGYPCNSILIADETGRQNFIKKYEEQETLNLIEKLKQYNKIFVYMPTWRDSQRNIFAENINLDVINKIMQKTNSLFLLKPHANTIANKEIFANFENIFFIENNIDIYPVLPYTDVLVTDYSSVYYDYLLMQNKEIILYLYDLEDYAKQRDFRQEFLDDITSKKCYNFEELINTIESNNYSKSLQNKEDEITKFWSENWNKTIKQLSEEIITKTIKQ